MSLPPTAAVPDRINPTRANRLSRLLLPLLRIQVLFQLFGRDMARLRTETTLPIKAIARRIHLGTSKSANARLHAAMKSTAPTVPEQDSLGI